MSIPSRHSSTPHEEQTKMVKADRAILGVTFLTVLIDLIGFGIIIPLQPFYAETLGAQPWLITWLGASYSLMQFLFASVWGRLSDRIGRRPVLLGSIAITGIGYLIFGLAHTLSILFVARILAGMGAANIGTAQAIIADVTPRDQRAKGMGLIGAAFGIGFIIGPAIGGYFSRFGLHVPMFVAAGLCLLNLCLAYFLVPETRPGRRFESARPVAQGHGSFSWHALRHALQNTEVKTLLVMILVYTSAFSMMEQVLGLFIGHTWVVESDPLVRAQKSTEMTTYVLVLVGLTATIVQGGLIGRLTRRFGEVALLKVGLGTVAVTLGLIPFSPALGGYGALMLVSVGLAFGSGLMNPSMMSLLSRATSQDEQGGTLGLGQSLSALGRVFGPAIAGALFQFRAGFPFWLGGGLVLLCGLGAAKLNKNLDSKKR